MEIHDNLRYIVTSDIHLRSSVPRCRLETEEEWFEVQRESLRFLYSHNLPVVIAGDIFHHYNPGNRILELFLSFALKRTTYIMMGNHDARNGILDPDSGYGVLDRISKEGHPYLKDMAEFADYIPYHTDAVDGAVIQGKNKDILVLHTLTFKSDASAPPGTKFVTARSLLDQWPCYKYIITGDNHSHFLFDRDSRYVLNPGCVTKQSAIYKNEHLYCFRMEGDTIKVMDLIDEGELVDDAYIVATHDRDDRYNALVESLKIDSELSFDFKSNVYLTMDKNTLSKGTKEFIKEVLPC